MYKSRAHRIFELRPLWSGLKPIVALTVIISCGYVGHSADSLDAILQQSQDLIQKGDLATARSALERGLKAFPQNGNLYGLLGVVEAQSGNYAASETNFQKAIARIPHFTAAYLNLGQLYQVHAAKDPQALRKAAETYESLLRYEPENRDALYQCSHVLLRQGSYQRSLEYMARLPAADQESPQALSVKCAALAATGRSGEAGAVAELLLRHPQTAEIDVHTTVSFLESQGELKLAEKLLRGRTEGGHGTYQSFRALGQFYKRQERWKEARESLDLAAQFRPNDAPLLYELAQTAYGQNDFKGALGYLAHARELEPRSAKIHFFWGIVCIKENLVREAYESFQQATSLDPENPYYTYALGAAAFAHSRSAEAVASFQKYRRLRPTDPRGRLALGATYFDRSEFDHATRELQAAAESPETAAMAHYYLACMANLTGDRQGALRELHLGLKANPQSPENHAELGATYLKLRDYPQAEKALHQALKIDPDNETANLNLMILYQRTQDPRAAEQEKHYNEVRKKLQRTRTDILRSVEVER